MAFCMCVSLAVPRFCVMMSHACVLIYAGQQGLNQKNAVETLIPPIFFRVSKKILLDAKLDVNRVESNRLKSGDYATFTSNYCLSKML